MELSSRTFLNNPNKPLKTSIDTFAHGGTLDPCSPFAVTTAAHQLKEAPMLRRYHEPRSIAATLRSPVLWRSVASVTIQAMLLGLGALGVYVLLCL
jgi:hypothetical protein